MVLTSHDQLGDTGFKTGFWLEEFASPFYLFKEAGATITLASPKGGLPPLDPKSDEADFQTAATNRFVGDKQSQLLLANTTRLDSIDANDFDAVFYPGGHGPLWDLVDNKSSIKLIETLFQAGKPVGLVCHASAALRDTKIGDLPLVNGKRVTGFSNSEEDAVELTAIVPLLVEDMLKDKGGLYNKGDDWTSYLEVDGNLITGQNPASSQAVAQAMLEQLNVNE
jgi:putative intracellular protease/amidase